MYGVIEKMAAVAAGVGLVNESRELTEFFEDAGFEKKDFALAVLGTVNLIENTPGLKKAILDAKSPEEFEISAKNILFN